MTLIQNSHSPCGPLVILQTVRDSLHAHAHYSWQRNAVTAQLPVHDACIGLLQMHARSQTYTQATVMRRGQPRPWRQPAALGRGLCIAWIKAPQVRQLQATAAGNTSPSGCRLSFVLLSMIMRSSLGFLTDLHADSSYTQNATPSAWTFFILLAQECVSCFQATQPWLTFLMPSEHKALFFLLLATHPQRG